MINVYYLFKQASCKCSEESLSISIIYDCLIIGTLLHA